MWACQCQGQNGRTTETHGSFYPAVGNWHSGRAIGLSHHGCGSLTHCDACQLVCPDTNEASLPPPSPCHRQSTLSSLTIMKGTPPTQTRGTEAPSCFPPLHPSASSSPSAWPIRPLTPGAADKLFLSLALCLSLGQQRRGSGRGRGPFMLSKAGYINYKTAICRVKLC